MTLQATGQQAAPTGLKRQETRDALPGSGTGRSQSSSNESMRFCASETKSSSAGAGSGSGCCSGSTHTAAGLETGTLPALCAFSVAVRGPPPGPCRGLPHPCTRPPPAPGPRVRTLFALGEAPGLGSGTAAAAAAGAAARSPSFCSSVSARAIRTRGPFGIPISAKSLSEHSAMASRSISFCSSRGRNRSIPKPARN